MAYRIPNKNPIDVGSRVAIGVSIPFNAPQVFTQTYTTQDQVKSNIINFILTNKGERVFNPTFGSNITYDPSFEKWVQMKDGTFSNMTITFNDQNLNTLYALDPNILLTLLIRKIKKIKCLVNLYTSCPNTINYTQWEFKTP